MAVIDLKNEKRINSNGEWDKVTTHPNNEPIFRQNGYYLGLQPSNSDYIDCSNVSSWATLGDIDLSYTFNLRDTTSPSPTSILSRSIGANDRIELFVLNGQFAWRVNVGGASISSYTSSGLDLTEITTFSYVGAKAFVNGTEVLDDTASSGAALFSQNLFYLNQQTYSGISGMNINCIEHAFNNETFKPININSNAQIVGSSGTVAQVTSSAADPINYILGTVFQKSSFALGFDKSNNEYIQKTMFNPPFDYTELDESVEWVDNFAETGAYIIFDTRKNGAINSRVVCLSANSSRFQVEIWDSTGTRVVELNQNGVINVNGFNKLELKGLEIILNGVVLATMTNRTFDFTTSSQWLIGTNDTVYITSEIRGFRFEGVEYNLTEGLGNTTNGAEIITSAADSNERINFGMWQKNGNVLKFDLANQDKITTQSIPMVQNTSTIYIKCVLTNDWIGQGNQYLLYRNGGGGVLMNGTTGVINSISILTINQVKLNGVVVSTGLNFAERLGEVLEIFATYTLADSTEQWAFNGTFSGAANLSPQLFKIRIGDKNFLFREGNGETTTSEDGTTTAEIKTSAADSENYINEFVWNEDSDKWIDYKKV